MLDELAAHGIQPRDHTPPQLARELLNDLYTFELRRLRARLLRREFPKATYAGLVTEIRLRYPLLSVPVANWLEPPVPESEGPRGAEPGQGVK